MTPDYKTRLIEERNLNVENFDLIITTFINSVSSIKYIFELLNMDSQYLSDTIIQKSFILDSKDKKIFAAYDKTKLIGLLRIVGDKYSSYIDLLCIHPAYQRKGVGTKLLRAFEYYTEPVYLNVFADSSEEFYLKNGFQKNNGYLQKQIKKSNFAILQ